MGRVGMALYAGLTLGPGEPVEIEFQTPCLLRVAGIIRNRTAIASGWLGFFSADCGEKSDDIAAAVDEPVRR